MSEIYQFDLLNRVTIHNSEPYYQLSQLTELEALSCGHLKMEGRKTR
jgi:hypothetical protein